MSGCPFSAGGGEPPEGSPASSPDSPAGSPAAAAASASASAPGTGEHHGAQLDFSADMSYGDYRISTPC